MTRPAPLTDEARALLVTELRHGRAPDEAARGLGLDLSDVWIAARTDLRLTVALAGRDPNAAEETGRIARADYLRLLALGVTPSRAELILGAGEPGDWRADPAFNAACEAVIQAAAPHGYHGQTRLTPARVARFLEKLRSGATVKAAASAVSVTPPAIYQRRRRDVEFKKAMDEARAQGRAANRS
ncbi:hypothetical protein [Streptomyces sp. NRRL F-525]|uniref:hypothetical protein n=1 Tax=Streptomyces sp. NRRL F-525 TaxID=1463861 RepID=UPI00131A6340|nr:hypothetical protein [Streptomyces sp. NRRL F-525]